MLSTKNVGNKIAEARKKEGISQAQLAEQLFISPQAVGKWERGESMPDITTFNRLAEIFGVDLNYFSESFGATQKDATESIIQKSKETHFGKDKQKPKWDMSSANWVDADFSGLKNLHEKLSSSNLQRCTFIGSDLSGLLLKSNNVNGCDFSNSDIRSSHIQASQLANNIFKNCSLQETEFSGSHIKGCNLTEANLTGVKFKSGIFEKNTLENAVWNSTFFKEMIIKDTVVKGILEDCYFDNCSFKKVTFEHATLTNTFFKSTSLKRIRFIDCQADRMTYEFLKNAKADLSSVIVVDPKEGKS